VPRSSYLTHHVSGEAAQVGEPVAVFGGDDDPEGMTVIGAMLGKRAAVLDIALRTVELAAFAVAGCAVALQVAQMRRGSGAADSVAHDARLDHDPPLAVLRTPLRRLVLQPIGGGLAAPDARALSLPGHPAATPDAGRPGRRQRAAFRLPRGPHDLIDKGQRAAGSWACAIADAAGARAEVKSVVAGHDRKVAPTSLQDKLRPPAVA
jgi:hypothetical protein